MSKEYKITINGVCRTVTLNKIEINKLFFTVENHDYTVDVEPILKHTTNIVNTAPIIPHVLSSNNQINTSIEPNTVYAPMPGIVTKVSVDIGQHVHAGQQLLIIEAMKMENAINSTNSGIIKEILIKQGQDVKKGQALIVFE
jgi:biotin carboxyl carrier protein